MSRVRVLIVDDSVVVRRALSELLAADPGLEVVGTASNGKIALARLPQLSPDIVTLDVEMPEMDGLEALRQIRQSYPALPVLMVSRYTERCSEAALAARALGATDCLALPDGPPGGSLKWLRDELLPRLKQAAGAPRQGGSLIARMSRFTAATSRVNVVALGTSTGGPNALAALLPRLPASLPVPVVIVQHMPAAFTRPLADRLRGLAALPVREAVAGVALAPGQVWLAPGDQHLTVRREGADCVLRLDRSPPENSCRPSVDVLFRSVAAAYGAGVLGVVLTGMGQDGLRGSRAIREAGGAVLAQDQATSVVWGMPGHVAQAGLAQQVLPLPEIAPEIVACALRGRALTALGGAPSCSR